MDAEFLFPFQEDPDDVITRHKCSSCERPFTVCWCQYIPLNPLNVTSTIIILQHPGEGKRCLRTSPMIEKCLSSENYRLFKGRRFPNSKHEGLLSILASPDTVLLYPSVGAKSIDEIPKVKDLGRPYNIVVLDGTWSQAKSMFHHSPELHKLSKVYIGSGKSEYVIRTQPTEGCLSTLETVAIALSCLENRVDVYDTMLKPLRALCQYQLCHGAVEHQDMVSRLESCPPDKLPRRTRKKYGKFISAVS